MSARNCSIAIIGDIHTEFAVELGDAGFQSITSNTQYNRTIRSMVGGTAAHIARYATSTFGAVKLIGAVGDDDFGELTVRLLQQQGIETHTTHITDAPTGIVLNIRARSPSDTGDVRLLVVHKGANTCLAPNDVDALGDVIRRSSILHFDGYSLLEQPRRDAVERALHIARSADVLVSCDLVPHDMHRHFGIEELSPWLNLTSVIFVEARTVQALCGNAWTENDGTHDLALSAWGLLQARFSHMRAFIQFGIGNVDETLICVAGMSPIRRRNGYCTSNSAGFGDRMTVQDLADVLGSVTAHER